MRTIFNYQIISLTKNSIHIHAQSNRRRNYIKYYVRKPYDTNGNLYVVSEKKGPDNIHCKRVT